MPGRALFVTWDGGGNVNPVLAAANGLGHRGWTVVVHGPPSLAPRFAADGITYDPRNVPDPWDQVDMARDVGDACQRVEADVVVVDYMLPAALCGAEAAGRPALALVHTLYRALLVDGAPGPMSMATTVESLNAVRSDLGLASVESLGDLLARCPHVLVTCPRELDDPDGATSGNVRYLGPLLEDAGSDAGWRPTPCDLAGGDPAVVVSMGTTPMGEGPVLQRVLDALAEEPVRVLAMLGSHVDPDGLRCPPNAWTTGYVRHAAVFPHADLLVTHAGLGTVLASLAHGVPMVCLPLGREQPENATAVERVGAGRQLPADAPESDIVKAVQEVHGQAGPRAAAQKLAATIAASDGRAELEALLAALVT